MQFAYLLHSYFLALSLNYLVESIQSLSTTTSSSRPPSASKLVSSLQTCFTPEQVLDRVARNLSRSVDPDGSISSLVLVRLSKQLISLDNERRNTLSSKTLLQKEEDVGRIETAIGCLCNSSGGQNSLVEGTKACAVIARLLSTETDSSLLSPVVSFWDEQDASLPSSLKPHQLSGLKWSYDTFNFVEESTNGDSVVTPPHLQEAYDSLDLPFTIFPGCLSDELDFSVENLSSQVDFRVDDIRTKSNKVVKERRMTAWEGDDSVAPFEYASKSMPRLDWSPMVRTVRDALLKRTGEYYDGCLLNLYPDGQSGMRYHIDPDQGTLWDYDTAVVSVGASRKFAFRSIPSAVGSQREEEKEQPHSFYVLHGDVAHMFGACQQRFQHTIKKADNKNEKCARASLVFKRTWS